MPKARFTQSPSMALLASSVVVSHLLSSCSREKHTAHEETEKRDEPFSCIATMCRGNAKNDPQGKCQQTQEVRQITHVLLSFIQSSDANDTIT